MSDKATQKNKIRYRVVSLCWLLLLLFHIFYLFINKKTKKKTKKIHFFTFPNIFHKNKLNKRKEKKNSFYLAAQQ
jgi:hypothetical protein